jgi:acyl-CoA oxidase
MAASEGTYFDAWNGAVNTALDMARTRGVRLALEQLAAAVPALADERDRTALGLLASLYGLVEIRRDAGWYLAGGLVTGAAVEGLSAAVDGLCERLRPHARRLTEAFRLTPELLRAPLAYDDPEAAFLLRTGASGPTGRSGAAGPATTPPPRTPGK